MNEISTKSTSLVTAKVNPIVLRQTSTTRLVFCPTLIDNPKSPNAAVEGTFAFEKKGKNDAWEPFKMGKLSRLKKGEGISLALNTKETLDLFTALDELWTCGGEPAPV